MRPGQGPGFSKPCCLLCGEELIAFPFREAAGHLSIAEPGRREGSPGRSSQGLERHGLLFQVPQHPPLALPRLSFRRCILHNAYTSPIPASGPSRLSLHICGSLKVNVTLVADLGGKAPSDPEDGGGNCHGRGAHEVVVGGRTMGAGLQLRFVSASY